MGISPNPVTSHLRVNTDKDIRAIELYSIDGEIRVYNPEIKTIMKKGIIYLLLMFFPLMGVGYTPKLAPPAPRFEERIDHEVEVCGVKDPVVNMDWMQEELAKYSYREHLRIILYQDTLTNDTLFVFNEAGEVKSIHDCSGSRIYSVEEGREKEQSVMSSFVELKVIYYLAEIPSKDPIIEEWIDHEVEACGVQDPIVNLDWMETALDTEKGRQREFQVELRKCKETGDMVFVFPKKDADGNYIQFDVYNCAGEKIYSYEFINAIIPDRVISKYDFIQVVYTYKITYHTTRYEPPTHVGLGCSNSSGCSNGSDMSRPQY